MKPTKLYLEAGKCAICRICGKTIYRFGKGSQGVRSHAKMHVKEGTATEKYTPSFTSFSSYDVLYYVVPGTETKTPEELNLLKMAAEEGF